MLELVIIALALLGTYVVLHVWMPQHQRPAAEQRVRRARRG
jgi:hypothetical protein